jgi:hypothetical protein
LQYLADTPEILKDMEMMKPTANMGKGTRATAPINAWGRQLQVSWMLSTNKVIESEEEGEEPEIILNLHRIRSLRYLEEAQVWNPDGNYDTVSAMGMLFIYREEKLRQIQSIKEDDVEQTDAWADSEFFGHSSHEKRLSKIERAFKRPRS